MQHKTIVKELSRVLYYAKELKTDRDSLTTAPRGTAKVAPSVHAAAPAISDAPPSLTPPRAAPSTPKAAGGDIASYVPVAASERARWTEDHTAGRRYTPTQTDPPYRTTGLPFTRDVVVAMIADDFTFNSFKYEFDVKRLTPTNWRSVFEDSQPTLFLCESAWQGGSPQEHPWQAKVYASIRWPQENRVDLLSILDYCRAAGIPTVFWNKEDPTHFSDRINDFVRTACLFDYVFTTAEECVDGYLKHAGARHADVLPFAVQPMLFNPQGSQDARDDVNFAGTWYATYPERSLVAEQIMDLVLGTGRELVIYNRMFADKSARYAYPERYSQYIRPAISYQETARAFRRSQYGITLNTVTSSPTMFARRIFELAASGAVVLSNSSQGVRNFFGDSVIYADVEPERFLSLTEDARRDLQRRAMAIALGNTYGHRAETILGALGMKFESRYASPQLAGVVETQAEFDALYSQWASRPDFGDLLTVIGRNSDHGLIMDLMREKRPHVVVVAEDDVASGRVRTRSVMNRPGAILTKRNRPVPSIEDVKWLQAHSVYEQSVIELAGSASSRFRFGPANPSATPYVPAAQLGTYLLRPAESFSYMV
ncbi:CgeB family protein [Tessaracoccus lapidicaptus]|uniref:CgeB family protein n=1 Tax=Tessaracoccus lapidicaptus TaxID=1427523 RepID=UPI00333E4B0D